MSAAGRVWRVGWRGPSQLPAAAVRHRLQLDLDLEVTFPPAQSAGWVP